MKTHFLCSGEAIYLLVLVGWVTGQTQVTNFESIEGSHGDMFRSISNEEVGGGLLILPYFVRAKSNVDRYLCMHDELVSTCRCSLGS